MSASVTTQTPLRKSHRSALVVPVPHSPQIKEIRTELEHKSHRWMPHINLAYPFHPYDCATQRSTAQMIRRLCEQIPSFSVQLKEIEYFQQRSGRSLFYVAPKNTAPFRNLQEALAEIFPDCADVAHYTRGYQPHMILGASPKGQNPARLLLRLQNKWHPINFRVDTISWAMGSDTGPFASGEHFNLLTSH